MFHVFLLFLFSAASGSGLYHSRNRTFTAEMVDISVPAILIDGQSQIKNIVGYDFN